MQQLWTAGYQFNTSKQSKNKVTIHILSKIKCLIKNK